VTRHGRRPLDLAHKCAGHRGSISDHCSVFGRLHVATGGAAGALLRSRSLPCARPGCTSRRPGAARGNFPTEDSRSAAARHARYAGRPERSLRPPCWESGGLGARSRARRPLARCAGEALSPRRWPARSRHIRRGAVLWQERSSGCCWPTAGGLAREGRGSVGSLLVVVRRGVVDIARSRRARYGRWDRRTRLMIGNDPAGLFPQSLLHPNGDDGETTVRGMIPSAVGGSPRHTATFETVIKPCGRCRGCAARSRARTSNLIHVTERRSHAQPGGARFSGTGPAVATFPRPASPRGGRRRYLWGFSRQARPELAGSRRRPGTDCRLCAAIQVIPNASSRRLRSSRGRRDSDRVPRPADPRQGLTVLRDWPHCARAVCGLRVAGADPLAVRLCTRLDCRTRDPDVLGFIDDETLNADLSREAPSCAVAPATRASGW